MHPDEKWHGFERAKEKLAFDRILRGYARLRENDPNARIIRNWLEHNGDPNIKETLAWYVAKPPKLTEWEKLSSEVRKRKAERIASLARQLSAELATVPDPDSPLAISLSDTKHAMILLNTVFQYSEDFTKDVMRLSPILESIADYADTLKHTKIRDSRPNTGSPDARVLAKVIAERLIELNCPLSSTLIAAVVALAHPEADPPPTPELVRDWLRTAGYST